MQQLFYPLLAVGCNGNYCVGLRSPRQLGYYFNLFVMVGFVLNQGVYFYSSFCIRNLRCMNLHAPIADIQFRGMDEPYMSVDS